MNSYTPYCLFIVVLTLLSLASCERVGHLKPFGTGPSEPVHEVDGFPNPVEFYTNFQKPGLPVVMRGAAKLSPAFHLWTDEYFLSQSEASSFKVLVETKKKEDRSQKTLKMPFAEFVTKYNKSEVYMVQMIPPFLLKDYVLPWPLQCESWKNALVQALMWFSSGGTSSVAHTDEVENINCVIRGEKTLILVDRSRFEGRIPINDNGAFSPIDVDSVDFDKYPSIEGVEYFHVNMTPGDCLFIPFKWVHQVRSYKSNLAVNIWFDAKLSSVPEIVPTGCSEMFDPSWTLDVCEVMGMEQMELRKNIDGMIENEGPVDINKFIDTFIPESEKFVHTYGSGIKMPLFELFSTLDMNKDGILDQNDLKMARNEDYNRAARHFEQFDHLFRTIQADVSEEMNHQNHHDEF